MRIRTRVLLGLAAAVSLVARAAASHELGTLRTYVTFRRDGRYEVEVYVDREHLPPRFAESAEAPRLPDRPLRGRARNRQG